MMWLFGLCQWWVSKRMRIRAGRLSTRDRHHRTGTKRCLRQRGCQILLYSIFQAVNDCLFTMPTRCAVPGCSERGGHQFPTKTDERNAWVHAIRRAADKRGSRWSPKPYMVVCHAHFLPTDYVQLEGNETVHGNTTTIVCYCTWVLFIRTSL